MIAAILFSGKEFSYHALDQVIGMAEMFGFVKNRDGIVTIANRFFEMVFYNLFLTSAENQRGNAYNERGQEQLIAYLDHYHLKKGYMLSYNFNKKKEIGVRQLVFGDKVLVEAVV